MEMSATLAGFILGIFFGSFMNVCIDRLPRGQSIVWPPSHCAACGKKLRSLDLIPIISYLWIKGRCRYCGAGITRRIFAVELAVGILFALISFSYGLSVEFLVLAFYTCLFLVVAVIDLEHGLILNKITYPAIGLSLVLSPFWPSLWPSLGSSRTLIWESTMPYNFLSSLSGGGILFVFFLLIALFYKEGIGWGDVKLGGLVGLVTGFPLVLVAMGISFLSGGLVAGVLLLLRRRGWKEGIPYGPFLSLGALVALVWGEDLIDWYLTL